MDGDRGAQTAALPSERVLRWVAGVVGGMRVVSVENPSRSTHRPSGTFRVRVDGTPTGARDLILKFPASGSTTSSSASTNPVSPSPASGPVSPRKSRCSERRSGGFRDSSIRQRPTFASWALTQRLTGSSAVSKAANPSDSEHAAAHPLCASSDGREREGAGDLW